MENLVSRVLSGRYRVDEFIDQGGMSYIYKAWDLVLQRDVALKVLKPELANDREFTERFIIEAMAACKMKHENIVTLYDVGFEGDIRYLALEYVEGKNIKELINEQTCFDELRACQIITQVLRALEHAHSKNIIHRDIKPENIVIDKSGNAKVLDFGIARITEDQSVTKANVAIGTVQYVSPEQVLGKEITAASDIYSLGLVFYEMLTGRRAFDGTEAVNILLKQINEDPPRPRSIKPELSDGVEKVLLCALQKDKEKRYSSATEMLADMFAIMNGKEPAIARKVMHEIEQEKRAKEAEKIAVQKHLRAKERQKNIHNVKRSVKKHYNVFLWAIPVFLIIISGIIYWGMGFINNVTQTVYAPDLVGMEQLKAVENARSVDLAPLIKYVYHDTISENTVIDQTPVYQTPMHRGDTITLEVSRGREGDVVPNLANLSLRDAYNIASKKNFTISVVERIASREIEEGIILEQQIKPGEPIPQNRIIQVKVSGGLVYVPDFTNLTLEQAIQRCHDLELTLDSVSYNDVSDPAQLGKVLKQNPDAGNAVILGTNINLIVGSADREYKGEIIIDTTGLELNTEIKVTLIEGNKETIQYVGSYKPDGDSQMVVPIQSNFSTNIKANIYINNQLRETREVNLR